MNVVLCCQNMPILVHTDVAAVISASVCLGWQQQHIPWHKATHAWFSVLIVRLSVPVSVYLAEAAGPAGRPHDGLRWVCRSGPITPPHWCLSAWELSHSRFLWEGEVRKQLKTQVLLLLWLYCRKMCLQVRRAMWVFSFLTNVSCGSCLIQDVGVTGWVLSHQNHTQVGSLVAR